jgi:nitrogen regulatory protein PII
MKAVLIAYHQILADEMLGVLDAQGIRGFTRWSDVQGRGSDAGEPHMGSHTWPALNGALLCVVDDAQVAPLLDALRNLGRAAEAEGIRSFVWAIEQAV